MMYIYNTTVMSAAKKYWKELELVSRSARSCRRHHVTAAMDVRAQACVRARALVRLYVAQHLSFFLSCRRHHVTA
jgi:hypothetical protein